MKANEHFHHRLTGRQAEVLSFIRAAIALNGMPPTRQEIATHFKFGSTNAAEQHLHALANKGAIVLIEGKVRGIVLARAGHAAQAVEDLAAMRARTIVEALALLESTSCGHCTYEESDGELLSHCDRCCRKIVAALGLVRRRLTKGLSLAREAARQPVKRTRFYNRTHRGGTLGRQS